jgi:hypothetical protein
MLGWSASSGGRDFQREAGLRLAMAMTLPVLNAAGRLIQWLSADY